MSQPFMTKSPAYEFTPIGYLQTSKKGKSEASRQPQCDTGSTGIIELTINEAELSLKELSGFSHLWILFVFHHNTNWKPLTMPPRLQRKVGVLATRSPFRPNPIGMSCVKIIKIEGCKIEIGHHDLLDGTPILDIKPYLEYADSITGTSPGWTLECDKNTFEVQWSENEKQQADFLISRGVSEIENVVTNQLSFEPIDKKRKRIKTTMIDNEFILSYRTWRIQFEVSESLVRILKIFSGYTTEELLSDDDIYADKQIHREFNTYLLRTPKS
jgi:tRNA-Thr(GGU) m(6)t(6)A37 methyltransferase TsaA